MSKSISFSVKRRSNRNGVVASLVVIGIVAAALVSAGLYFYWSQSNKQAAIQPIMATVTSGEFVSQVLDQGEIQSSENVEIRCAVRARNGSISVIEVVPEGTRVKGGDFLVQLDSSSFDKEMEQQKISLANAQTQLIQADADVKVADESKNEYIEGTFKQEIKTIENEVYDAQSAITTAEQELNQAKVVVNHSKKLLNKGFITKQAMETDEFAVKTAEIKLRKANNSLELALKKKEILETISRKKELIQLESNIEAAKIKYLNAKESLEVEKQKEAEILDMIDKCNIRVPEGVEGQVVYAKESSRGGNDWVLEEGTTVRERQVLVRLPNPDKMEVKALINEQSITQIKNGMPCTINVDALKGEALTGVVTKVNQYAESGGWMSGGGVRKYAVFVQILNPPEALKPGMNASVTIQVRFEEDAKLAPIQTVYAVGDQQFCLVKNGDQWETREVEIDGDNSKMVLIKSGLEVGDEVVMNPAAYKKYMDLPTVKNETKIEISEDAISKAKALSNKNQVDNSAAGKAGDGRSDGGRQGGGRQGGGGGMMERMMAMDANGDGKVSKDEAPEQMKSFFDRMDPNKDGFITKDELESMASRFGGGGGRGGGGRQGGGRPGGGGGGK